MNQRAIIAGTLALLGAVACGQSTMPAPADQSSPPAQPPAADNPPAGDNPSETSEAEALQAPVVVSASSLRDRVTRLHLGGDQVTVVVELGGAPVAVARANAVNKQISAAETQAIAESLQTQQD